MDSVNQASAANPLESSGLPAPSRACALIAGGGTMGADVALVLARAGCRTLVLEPSEARRQALDAYLDSGLQNLGAAHRRDRISACASMDEVDWQAVDLVIECIPEKLAPKQALFAELERRARPDAVLTSNSSSFPISAIADGLASAARMFNLHFFMPAHLVPLVEVVLGDRSSPALAESLSTFMRGCGMVPVLVKKDLPGFLANRLQHAMAREAFAMIDAGIATPEDVDAAVPFRLRLPLPGGRPGAAARPCGHRRPLPGRGHHVPVAGDQYGAGPGADRAPGKRQVRHENRRGLLQVDA